MVENSGTADDSRDAVLLTPDPEEARKNGALPTTTPSLLLPRAAVGAAKPKGFLVGAAAKKAAGAPSTPRPRIGKPTAAAKGGRPPRSPTDTAAAGKKVQHHHLKRSLGDGSSNPQFGSQASQVQSDSVPISGSPQLESTNDSPINIDDDDEEEEEEEEAAVKAGSKRKLKSEVWKEFTLVQIGSTEYAKCNHCAKKLSARSRNGTNHLRLHLKSCVLKKIKLKGQSMVQTAVRFDRTDAGTISVENYTFDQEIARKELSAMIVLHEYPLSLVDHVGFRRFVAALQPLFKMVTRNTIRSDIMVQYELEKKKAIEYMAYLLLTTYC